MAISKIRPTLKSDWALFLLPQALGERLFKHSILVRLMFVTFSMYFCPKISKYLTGQFFKSLGLIKCIRGWTHTGLKLWFVKTLCNLVILTKSLSPKSVSRDHRLLKGFQNEASQYSIQKKNTRTNHDKCKIVIRDTQPEWYQCYWSWCWHHYCDSLINTEMWSSGTSFYSDIVLVEPNVPNKVKLDIKCSVFYKAFALLDSQSSSFDPDFTR